MITRFIRNSSLAIFIYSAISLVVGATELNNRVTATVDSQGQLTIESGYLTNYLIRGVDRNGETGTFYLLNRNEKALDFDMADIEFDGFLPSVDFKLPTFNTESTTIDLANYNYPNKQGTEYWKNTDFVIKGASLVDLAVNFPSNAEDRIDVTGLLLLNTLTVIDTVTNTVTISDKSKFATTFKKLNKLSSEINNYKKTLEKATTILAFSDLFVAQIDAFVEAANISDSELEDYESLTDVLFWYKQLSHNIKLLNNVVNKKTEDTEIAKDILSKEYLVLFKDVAQGSAESILDTTVDTFAQQYGSATNKNDKTLLVNKYVVSPLASTMKAYREYLEKELIALEENISRDENKITAKKEQIRFLRNSYAIIQLAKLLFATDDIATIAKNEPEKIVPVLIEVAAIVKDEVFTLDNTKDLIDKTMGKAATKALYAKAGKAVPYMKAIQVGEGIGNKLIPLLWDLVLGENKISTSIVNGEISSFGYPDTDVTIAINNKNYQQFNNVSDRLTQYIAADKGDTISIGANMYRPLLFDETRAPWYLNTNHVPSLVYQAIIITPSLTTQTAFCVKKLLGALDYVTQKHIDARYIFDVNVCGAGTMLGGYDAFDDKISEYHPQTHYNDDELPDALKLATQQHTLAGAIDSINYQVTDDRNQVIYVRFSGLEHNDIVHKFHIVPTQGADDISIDTTSTTANDLTLKINIALSQDNLNDPIVEILINWGDGSGESSITGTEFTHTYAEVGQFQPTVKVIRQSGQISSQEFSVDLQEVIDQAAPTVNAGEDQEVTAGEIVTLNAMVAKTTGTFLWEKVVGKAIVVEDYTTQSISFEAPQTDEQTQLLFRVTVEGTDGSQKTDAVKVTVNPAIVANVAPTVDAGKNQSVISGTTVTLTAIAQDSDGRIKEILWRQTSGADIVDIENSQTLQALLIAPSTPQTMTFEITVKDDVGAKSSDEVTITVVETPVANGFDYPVGNRGVVNGASVGFPEQIFAEINHVYETQTGIGDNDVRLATNFDASQWRNAQDVGSFLAGYGVHAGEDWNLGGKNDDAGEAVYAVANGTIHSVRTSFQSGVQSGGWTIVIEHTLPDNSNLYSVYTHLTATSATDGDIVSSAANFDVYEGQYIARGTLIGNLAKNMSEIAYSHLHFELRTIAPPTSGSFWPNANSVGYYAPNKARPQTMKSPEIANAFNIMATQEGLIDPSDWIDYNRPDVQGQITSISPTNVKANSSVEFTVKGRELPSTIVMSLFGSSACDAAHEVGSTSAKVRCDIGDALGTRPFYIKDKSQGLFLKDTQRLVVTVEQAVVNEREVLGVTFTDLAFAQCVQAQVTAKGVSALSELTTLDCTNKGIVDVSELSHLTGLVTLGLDNNQIVNVSLDANQELKLVGLRNNPLSQATKDYLATVNWIANLYYENKSPVVASGKLNDTGITTCSNATENGLSCPVSGVEGQDGEHGRDVTHNDDSDGHAGFSFTKIGASGNELAADASQWACIKDNVTGFMWEVKTDDGTLQDKDNTYTWYNSTGINDGGNAGTADGGQCPSTGQCDTEKYVANINAQSLCGYSDWRLPARETLRSIVDYSRVSPVIDTNYFKHTQADLFWSSSPYANSSYNAWSVNFYYGYDGTSYKYNYRYVRLVRGGQ